jgi:hypothetical protein
MKLVVYGDGSRNAVSLALKKFQLMEGIDSLVLCDLSKASDHASAWADLCDVPAVRVPFQSERFGLAATLWQGFAVMFHVAAVRRLQHRRYGDQVMNETGYTNRRPGVVPLAEKLQKLNPKWSRDRALCAAKAHLTSAYKAALSKKTGLMEAKAAR